MQIERERKTGHTREWEGETSGVSRYFLYWVQVHDQMTSIAQVDA